MNKAIRILPPFGALLGMALPFFAGTSVSHAAEPAPFVRVTQAKKVLGRGIQDKHGEEAFQLACVGAPVTEGSLEPDCNRMRFLYRDETGREFLAGPTIRIEPGADIVEQIRAQLTEYQIFQSDKKIQYGGLHNVDNGEYYFGRGIRGMIGMSTLLVFDKSFHNFGISSGDVNSSLSRAVKAWSIRPARIKSFHFQFMKLLIFGTSAGTYSGPCPFLSPEQQKLRPLNSVDNFSACKLTITGPDYQMLLSGNPNSLLEKAVTERP